MKKKVIFIILVIFLSIVISGCLEEKKDNIEDTNNDDNSNQNYQEMILGTWTKNETVENLTYKIVYKFAYYHSSASARRNSSLRVLLPPVARPVSSSRLMKRRGPPRAWVRRGISSRGVGRWPSSIRAG